MKKIALFVSLIAGVSFAADYTPVTREAPGGQNVNGQITITSDSLSLTNGQVITLGDYPVILVSAAGQASETSTNTIAAAASAKVGASYTIVNVGASNGVLVADSSPVFSTGATLGLNDSVTFFVRATNAIVQTATSNN